jgi:hypothetical protein
LKAASNKEDSLMSWVDSPEEQVNDRGNFKRIAYSYQEKFASEEVNSTDEVYDNPYKSLVSVVSEQRVKEAYEQVVADKKDEIADAYRQIEDTFRYNWGNIKFAQVEQDALYSIGEHIQPTLDIIANTFTKSALKVERNTKGAGERRLIQDEYNLLPLIDSIHQNSLMLDAAAELKESYMPEKKASVSSDDEWAELVHMPKAASSTPSAFGNQTEEDEDTVAGEEKSEGSKKKPEFNTDMGEPIQGGSLNITLNKGESVDKKEKTKEPFPIYQSQLKPEVTKVISLSKDLLDVDEGEHPDQAEVDSDFERMRWKLTVERLLNTDDVIGEYDPKKVISMAQTLYNINPKVINDHNNLRFILRESLAYDGIPTSIIETLAKAQQRTPQA